MTEKEHIRLRTDAILSFITNQPISKEMMESLDGVTDIDSLDNMVNAMIQIPKLPSQYRMRDLNKPSPINNIQFGSGMDDYVSNQRRLS